MTDSYTMTGLEWLEEVRRMLDDKCQMMVAACKTVSLGNVETSYGIRFRTKSSPKTQRKCRMVAMRLRISEIQKELEELEADDHNDP